MRIAVVFAAAVVALAPGCSSPAASQASRPAAAGRNSKNSETHMGRAKKDSAEHRASQARASAKPAGGALRIFDGTDRLIVVNGYSTSFHWPKILQRKLDRFMAGKQTLQVRRATKGGTPTAKWIDVETGRPKQPWRIVRDALKRPDSVTATIVLAQQSLQWVYGDRREGIRGEDDGDRIRKGADALEKYARLLLADGADLVFVAMHIYKHRMEPAIGNERYALAELMKRKIPGVLAGPDVWTPTKRHYPKAFARDLAHPNAIGAEIMAQRWFETLLEYDGLNVPAWSREEMQMAIEGPAPQERPRGRAGRPGQRGPARRDAEAVRDTEAATRPAEHSIATVGVIQWINPPSEKWPGVQHRTFRSAAMNTDVGFNIYLPPDYPAGKGRYPVVYYLHGLVGDESKHVQLSAHLHKAIVEKKVPPMIMVFVNGGRGTMYSDSVDGKILPATAIIKELIPFVDKHYRTIATARGRAIEGFSMGGFGALKLAFQHPETFCSAISYGGALHNLESFSTRRRERYEQIFGGKPEAFQANSPHELARSKAEQIRQRLQIRLVAGSQDQTLAHNERFRKLLDELKIPYQWELVEGVGHNIARYYELVGVKGLGFHLQALKARPETAP